MPSSTLSSQDNKEAIQRSTSMKSKNRPTVILSPCESYDVEMISERIKYGLEHMALEPSGRVLIKPNVVVSGDRFPHAYTRPEFIEGVASALREHAEVGAVEEWAIGERCGITMPTRYAYKGAGYYPMAKRVGFKLYHFDEVPQVEIPLSHERRLRDHIFTPEPVARADFFVNCPKFKAHPWTTVTFSLKNYIGIQDDRHRLIDHDHRLNEKVVDLQYITQPQFIAIDAITAGEGRMLTPIPFDLGLIIMGNNQVAFDAVCCHIIGIDPLTVPHIRLAYEHGFGPIDLSEIDIVGDLEAAQARAHGFRVGLIKVEEYFEGSSIKAYGGRPPADGDEDYCWGGCPGALEEAIEILRLYDAQADEKIPPMHIVFGHYDGEIDAQPEEKVIFVGDCASFEGQVGDDLVEIESTYRDRSDIDPREAKAEDIFVKMLKMRRLMSSKDQVMTLRGCPVSVAEQVLMLVKLGRLKNPYLDPKQALLFNVCYFSWRTRLLVQNLFGGSQLRLAYEGRGDAQPSVTHPVGAQFETLDGDDGDPPL